MPSRLERRLPCVALALALASLVAVSPAQAQPPTARVAEAALPPPPAPGPPPPVADPLPAELGRWDPSQESPPAAVDPLLVVGLSFLPASASALGLGAVELDGELYDECGVGGCTERLRDPESSFGPAMLTMGATAGLFAVTTIGIGAWNTSRSQATPPLAVAGSWMLGNGLSTLGMGAVMLGVGNDGDGAAGILAVTGALTTATGGGLLLASAAADHDRYEPRSLGKLSTGIALAATAAASAPPTVLLCAAATEASDTFLGDTFLLYCVPSALGTAGVAAAGAILWGLGADSAQDDSFAIDIGPGGAHLRARW